MKSAIAALAFGLALLSGFAPSFAAESITGAGSTFVYPLLAKWSDDYSKQGGAKINYQSIGSGGGIAQIKAGTVTFGASDMPLPPADLHEAGLLQFPAVVGAVVPAVNLPGIAPGALRLTGPALADIYLGRVKTWNDPEIVSLNPGLTLPAMAITVVHRSDGSGTTFNWVDYLAKVSPEWKARIGEGTSVSWPAGVGGKGNEGVAAYIQRIKGSIGYLEYAYILQNKMSYALVQNAAGRYPEPGKASFQAAAASAEWSKTSDFDLVLTNAPGDDAYPIAATSFILIHRTALATPAGKAALDFFRWAFAHGDADAEALAYVPLPASLTAAIEAYWQANQP
ncbi:MAG: phosphate ABC transporter substrate-binding protein PstS [Acidibrevibacterium sp.]|jgi:phosphate transport system substrate-binding protein|uniref:phosphate ABC transporter substrate-binding protein PstS n=1 Tax=Acidibrevibacterium fodinaquatile TaxID=1969806 RepID=UPI000E0DB04E|nr:phosphate ABC transporter substrate-binding protein PstS [Acidibrevibacterium fodinaquatile]MCA7119169.1 phosphate ABC transporter substrate-binding protein PstS [Acidibrevibacterium fodinaquatile]